MLRFVYLILFFSVYCEAGTWDRVPLLFEGRFRPATAIQKIIEERREIESSWEDLLAIDPKDAYPILYQERSKKSLSPSQIAQSLESASPLHERILSCRTGLPSLPWKYGEWINLSALELTICDPHTGILTPLPNFTLYSDEQFRRIRSAYFDWKRERNAATRESLGLALEEAYGEIAGTPYFEGMGKKKHYPSRRILFWEAVYYRFPLFKMLWALSLLSLFLLTLGQRTGFLTFAGLCTAAALFLFHSSLLLLRVCILGRPPVSNMGETLLYVPWVVLLLGWVHFYWTRRPLVIQAALVSSAILLSFPSIFGIPIGMENVPPVLDSQFWLTIHVLCVVGSYGAFAFASILGHISLAGRKNADVSHLPLQRSLYAGLFLLIIGTCLGGVWAAQSWGRFWDWDPKESWAFLSICTYLIVLHLYRFAKIGHFGLAVGAVAGFLVISFTWYGVNYLLGTGLHSYGFGAGGAPIYGAFILLELLFLLFCWERRRREVAGL